MTAGDRYGATASSPACHEIVEARGQAPATPLARRAPRAHARGRARRTRSMGGRRAARRRARPLPRRIGFSRRF